VLRSALFVPANREGWVAKAIRTGADSIILDLEDAVPVDQKIASRELARLGVRELAEAGVHAQVRVNGWDTGLTGDDVRSVLDSDLPSECQPEILLPKVRAADDLRRLGRFLRVVEGDLGLEIGSVHTPLGLETAESMRAAYKILRSCPRVRVFFLAAGAGGDASRSVGYVWSKSGIETLYLRSKAVLDARSAGIMYPMVSSWWEIADLEGLERDARFNRSLGFRGMVVMHPSHVEVVNRVFTPSQEELDHARGLVAAFEEAERNGRAAVIYDGDMIDRAMAESARQLLDFAASLAQL
jgi:citrate lyase subunit beta/citryl-CoA lyase